MDVILKQATTLVLHGGNRHIIGINVVSSWLKNLESTCCKSYQFVSYE